MRAVNLIPADQRRGAGGAAGRSGGGVYIFLGALALLVAMSAAYVLTGKSVDDKKSQLAQITSQAAAAEQRSSALADYTKFASVRAKREQTVQQLAGGRFDWAHSLREIARVLPTNAWLTHLTGTTSPTVSIASSGGGSSLRGALAVPAIQIDGCTTSQASVAKMMARMRLIDGVQRVSLQKSEKNDSAQAGSSADASNASDCRGASRHFPQFSIIVFLDPPAGAATSSTGGSTTTAAAVTSSTATPSSGTSAAPASSSTTPTSSTAATTGGTTP
jgi:Tfp pilus assembly protein PilN